MATIRLRFYFIVLIFSVVFASPSPLLPGPDLHKWCKRTTNADICTLILDGDPRNYLKKSASGFCTILNDVAKRIAHGIAGKITDLLNGSEGIQPPEVRRLLKSCLTDYGRIIPNLDRQNYTELNAKTYSELKLGLAEAHDEAAACESSFKPPKPLTAENHAFLSVDETTAQILNINHCNRTLTCN